MTGSVDDLDRRVLRALAADGRASAREVAEAAGVATATARNRMHRLEERGVIEGYRPVVDYGRLGFDLAAVFRLDVAAGAAESVVAALQATGRMVAVYEVTGAHDVVAVGKFRDAGELNDAARTLLAHEDVRSTSANVVRDASHERDPPL